MGLFTDQQTTVVTKQGMAKILQKLHFYIHCLIKKSSYDFKKYLLVTELFVNCLQKFYVLNFVNMTLKP